MSGKSILDLKPGERGHIGAIRGLGSTRQRLLDMGLLPRQEIRVERVAPGGAPVWVMLNGTHLALRRGEAEMVLLADTSGPVNDAIAPAPATSTTSKRPSES